jgi:hypothetical protein
MKNLYKKLLAIQTDEMKTLFGISLQVLPQKIEKSMFFASYNSLMLF